MADYSNEMLKMCWEAKEGPCVELSWYHGEKGYCHFCEKQHFFGCYEATSDAECTDYAPDKHTV